MCTSDIKSGSALLTAFESQNKQGVHPTPRQPRRFYIYRAAEPRQDLSRACGERQESLDLHIQY